MKDHIHRIRDELPAVLLFLAAIWGVFLLDRVLPLERFGLIPRDWGGLMGVVTMPFLHANFAHLLNNLLGRSDNGLFRQIDRIGTHVGNFSRLV